jgi:hypothetical protein
VSAWVTPALATALWAGLLAQPRIGRFAEAWVWLLGGALLLAAAVAGAPRDPDGDRVLERAGLLERDRADLLEAVGPPNAGRSSFVPALLVTLAGSFLLAVGWGTVHEHRVQGAVVARVAPANVVVEGILRTDPVAEHDEWSAILDVRSVTWDEGSTTVRETVWLSGRDRPPNAVRGDVVGVAGSVRPIEDEGFAEFLLRRGISAELEVDQAERLGPAPSVPVRWAQSFRALAGRSILSSFPPREAGLLLGLALGDDSRLDPALERDFRATGLSHLLVVSGENVSLVGVSPEGRGGWASASTRGSAATWTGTRPRRPVRRRTPGALPERRAGRSPTSMRTSICRPSRREFVARPMSDSSRTSGAVRSMASSSGS